MANELKRKFKVATLGCPESAGMISEGRFPGHEKEGQFRKEYEIYDLVACWDEDERNSEIVSKAWGIAARSLEDILNDTSIEIVQVCGSPENTYEICKSALEHGKHVCTSKMIGRNMEEGRKLVQLAREKGLRLSSAPDGLLGGGMQTLRYIVDKGIVGKINSGMISLTRDNRVMSESLPYLI